MQWHYRRAGFSGHAVGLRGRRMTSEVVHDLKLELLDLDNLCFRISSASK